MKRSTLSLIIGVLILGAAMWSLSSCSTSVIPTRFDRLPVKITHDSVCYDELVRVSYKLKALGSQVDFKFVSSTDSVDARLYRVIGTEYFGYQNLRPVSVIFANQRERKDGLLFLLKTETRTIVVGLKCFE